MDKEAVIRLQERFGIAHDSFRESAYPRLMGGWTRIVDTRQTSPHYKESGLYAALYSRESPDAQGSEKEFILAFRGYDEPEDFDDMLHITMDQIPDQVADGYHFARAMIAQYNIPPRKLECVGHSMGGYLSKAVGLLLQSETIHAFNSPGIDQDSLPMLSALRRNFIAHANDVDEDEIRRTVLAVVSSEDHIARMGDHHGRVVAVPTADYHHRLSPLEDAIIKHFINPEEHEQHPRAVPAKFPSAWQHFRHIMTPKN